MDVKLLTAVLSAGVALAGTGVSMWSAATARAAKQAAQDLAEQRFEAETTLAILERAYRELVQGDAVEALLACHYVLTLADLEVDARAEGGRLFIAPFLQTLGDEGALHPRCVPRAAALTTRLARADRAPAATPIAPDAVAAPAPRPAPAPPPQPAPRPAPAPPPAMIGREDPPAVEETFLPAPPDEGGVVPRDAGAVLPGYPETIGAWHALVAAFPAADCAAARATVVEVAALLQGSAAAGRPVYVAQVPRSGWLGVSVDAGVGAEAPDRAERLVGLARAAAPRSADGRTGADAHAVGNLGWRLSPDCREIRWIAGGDRGD